MLQSDNLVEGGKDNQYQYDMHAFVGMISSEWERLEAELRHVYELLICYNDLTARETVIVSGECYGLLRNFKGRFDLLNHARKWARLPADDTLENILKNIESLSKHRNNVIHGVIGGYSENNNQYGIVLLPPGHSTTHNRDKTGRLKPAYCYNLDRLRTLLALIRTQINDLWDWQKPVSDRRQDVLFPLRKATTENSAK